MATRYLHSLAHLSVLAETSVAEVQRIVAEIGAQPAVVVDLCPYYSGEVSGTVIARARGWNNQPAYHRTFHDCEIQT